MVYRLGMVPLESCQRDGNIRSQLVKEELKFLAESLPKRQIHPIVVCLIEGGGFRVLDGGKRVRAGLMAGMTELQAIITDEPLTEAEILDIQVVAAFHRSDLTAFDEWKAMEAVVAAHPGWTNKEIAAHLDICPKTVKILLSPGLCVPEVQIALRDKGLGISTCHELSLLPPEEQIPLLNLKLAGASRDAIARQARKQRKGTVDSVRVKRSKFARPSGNIVTLSGEELSLEEAAKELSDLATDMRKAEKDGLTIKTFMSACRDRAEAGV